MQRKYNILLLIAITILLLHTLTQRLLNHLVSNNNGYKNLIKRMGRKYLRNLDNQVNILALGDSLTEGLYNWPAMMMFHPYTMKLQELFNAHLVDVSVHVVNGGVSGEKVTKVNERLLAYLHNETQQLVIILAGTNDYLQVVKHTRHPVSILPHVSEIGKNISYGIMMLHEACHQKNITTAALTIPEIKYERHDLTNVSKLLRKTINKELKKYAHVHKDTTIFVDLASYLDKMGAVQEEYFRLWDDGVHMTPYGYDKMGEFIYHKVSHYIRRISLSRTSYYADTMA